MLADAGSTPATSTKILYINQPLVKVAFLLPHFCHIIDNEQAIEVAKTTGIFKAIKKPLIRGFLVFLARQLLGIQYHLCLFHLHI